jgi:hypothetical protein
MGLWFSMISRTTLRATLFTLLSAIVMVIGPGLLARAVETAPVRLGGDEAPDVHVLILDYGLTPPITMWTLCYNSGDLRQHPYGMLRLVAALCGLLCYVLLTVLMWVSMMHRLREARGWGTAVRDPVLSPTR